MSRWTFLLILVLSVLSLQRSLSQVPNGTAKAGRVPDRWLEPLPRVDGEDDLGLHGTGLVVPESIRRYWQTHSPRLNYTAATLPTAIDWSGYDSPVKAQGRCGACWAFAAAAAIESAGGQSDLSEQVLISCSGAGNCSGGFYENALTYVRDTGVPPEASYPYTEENGDCGNKSASPAFLERVRLTTTTMWGEMARLNDLKEALQNGPVVVSMIVNSDFDIYKSGIYHHTTGFFKGYHAVLCVGYNDEERCFRAKNSWGPGWGEGGYFRVSYDDLANGVDFGGYGAQVQGAYTEAISTGFEDVPVASSFMLEQNYPNPFNPTTSIKYTVGGTRDGGRGAGEAGGEGRGSGDRKTTLIVYDVLGRQVATLVDEVKAPGSYEVRFDGTRLASGVYYYRLTAGSFKETRVMMLTK